MAGVGPSSPSAQTGLVVGQNGSTFGGGGGGGGSGHETERNAFGRGGGGETEWQYFSGGYSSRFCLRMSTYDAPHGAYVQARGRRRMDPH